MIFLNIFVSLLIVFIFQIIFADNAYAWGPAVHTVISCSILDGLKFILPDIAAILKQFPLEYIYGNLAADFFIGKGSKRKEGHSHNWETGFSILGEAESEREAAYAYGFLSHLAADVVAHNYFVPDLIYRFIMLKKLGHFYSEAVADKFTGSFYLKMAADILSSKELECDKMLKAAVLANSGGFRAKKHIFKQSVKVSDYLYGSSQFSFVCNHSPYQIPAAYIDMMLNLSFRLVKDLLSNTGTSKCLSHDPIGEDNLRKASQNGFMSRIRNTRQHESKFPVDKELLELA
ncbi:MAG: zinc dependent phospholipase C family protein [Deltaproteobacteria bacterium]|nr:zinc dependent phospholipase C family protein [Deltaproteobacteria bacterium]